MTYRQRKTPRILLAEDDFEMRSLIATTLRRDGCSVLEVSNGFDLVDSLAALLDKGSDPPPLDLVLSDLRMPGLTGLEALARQRKVIGQIPFILITAFGGSDVLDAAAAKGATVVLDKPFDLSRLRTVVFALLGESASRRKDGVEPC